MAQVHDETFQGDEYDHNAAVTENVGAGSTVDGNSGGPGVMIAGSTLCLKVITGDPANDANIDIDIGSEEAVSYTRVYLYIADKNNDDYIYAWTAAWGDVWSIVLDGTLDLSVYKDGAMAYVDSFTPNEDQWYCIEVRYDVPGTAWEWKIDGNPEGNGVLTGGLRAGVQHVSLGLGAAVDTTLYFDWFEVDDATWVGAEVVPPDDPALISRDLGRGGRRVQVSSFGDYE